MAKLKQYLPDSAKEISFLGSSLVRLASLISASLIVTDHELLSLITIGLTWIGHEIEQYFKIHERKLKESDGNPQ